MASFPEILYNIANGAVVEITAHNKIYRGDFFLRRENPKPSEEDQITLENPTELPSGKKRNAVVTFKLLEIQNARVLELGIFKKKRDSEESSPIPISNGKQKSTGKGKAPARPIKSNKLPDEMKDFEPIEIQLKTFVIKESAQLKALLKLMKEIDVVGISLEGENVGRFGRVPWVVMTARKTLLPFDIVTLSETIPDIWDILDKNIFSNEKLTKIMHDVRQASDYLFHVHGIKLMNVFDTQVADAFVANQRFATVPDKLKPLSDCLTLYNRRIPPEEIEFLRKYESFDFSIKSPWVVRPVPPPEFLKLSAIKVKHLVPLRENLIGKMMERFAKCVETQADVLKNRSEEDYPSLVTGKPSVDVPKELMAVLELQL